MLVVHGTTTIFETSYFFLNSDTVSEALAPLIFFMLPPNFKLQRTLCVSYAMQVSILLE